MIITDAIEKNSNRIACLLRRYKVPGEVSEQTIEEAYNRHGTPFMTRFLEAIRDPETPENNFLGPPTMEATIAAAPPPQTGKFWSFLNNLTGAATQVSGSFAQVREDLTGQPAMANQYYMAQQRQNNLIYIAAFAAIIIVLIIIFKK
jgi:hypothetical protein